MSKGRILVVDDTATYRTILGDALGEKGYEVIYAADGLEAIQIIKEEMKTLDLVLLDLLMPKMLGFEVMRETRDLEGGADVRVMVITGLFKSQDDIKQVRDLGAVGFIDKSLPIEQIVDRVDTYLHSDWEETVEDQVPANLLVTYKVGERPYSAYTQSIGSKGMYIHTTKFAPPGAEVKGRFRLEENGETIEITGRVTLMVTEAGCVGTRKLPPGIEVEFTEISESDKADIEKFIRTRGRAKENGACKVKGPAEEAEQDV